MLTADSTQALGLKWAAGGGGSSPLTTKGDVYGYDTADARIPVGSDGQVLTADSTQTLGVKWAAGGGGATGVLLSGSADPAAPSVTIVQSTKSANDVSSLAFSAHVTAGNLLVVAFGASTSGGFTSPIVVSDTLGNTWVQQVNAQNTGQPTMTAIATCVTASSGADTVSVSGAGGANSQIVIAEISGNFTATADATGVATSGTTPPTLSLTKAHDLFFTAWYASGLPSVVGPEIFVQQITGNFWALNLAYVMESSSGAYASSLNGSTYGTVIASVALLANPPSSPGVDGDWYLNTTTGILWGPKTGGLWSKANITALDSVSLCTGFTPTNGQLLQYTTGGSPNPCWTAATAGGGTIPNTTQTLKGDGLDTVYAGDAGVDPMVVLALATTPVLSTALKTCTATTGIPWRASVTDAVAPALGVALTGGGTVFANVHCSLTTGHYIVDGL